MTWGPGQGTPIHDHAACGAWKASGTARWKSCSTTLVEHDGQRYRFQPVGSIQAGPGSAGSLIPPHEYHTIRNPSDDAVDGQPAHLFRPR